VARNWYAPCLGWDDPNAPAKGARTRLDILSQQGTRGSMAKNTNANRERHGHQVAFGDDTDELDNQPVGVRLTKPQGVGVPRVTDQDVPASRIELDEENTSSNPLRSGGSR
jgi:hypothetical protein